MGALSPWHLAILAVLVIALFGAKRLPETARGLGQSLKILKTELRGDAPAADASAAALPADTAPAQHTTTPGHATDSAPAAPPAQH